MYWNELGMKMNISVQALQYIEPVWLMIEGKADIKSHIKKKT